MKWLVGLVLGALLATIAVTTVGNTRNPGEFSAAEIATHSSTTSCWLLISNRVYDVTTYLRRHPGGIATVTPWCGKEASQAFATEAGRGEHSPAAHDLLRAYWIGVLASR
ncbi:cytochrome b5-like heme/steroid binding domain-containing protein [Mycobacterium sp. Marseille-P9652]|uniref:cytochrome b5-like heme/steroid binding domain-containing protein n=1 Tax=Mycobacterium sp. Marseille-P9652 TaxID=2654950 RepID=UPI0012E95B37|nr:cytochrome b5-like heme/steroid binding domain-containing protein [Mycobacterium sp. Marseille-P9652]